MPPSRISLAQRPLGSTTSCQYLNSYHHMFRVEHIDRNYTCLHACFNNTSKSRCRDLVCTHWNVFRWQYSRHDTIPEIQSFASTSWHRDTSSHGKLCGNIPKVQYEIPVKSKKNRICGPVDFSSSRVASVQRSWWLIQCKFKDIAAIAAWKATLELTDTSSPLFTDIDWHVLFAKGCASINLLNRRACRVTMVRPLWRVLAKAHNVRTATVVPRHVV